ncbi:MAG: sortase [Bacilli bacterium]|nr:sortase [Bacilli bacterium]
MLKKLSKNVKITLSILFCFIGLVLITYTYFDGIKSNLFNQKNIELLEQEIVISEELEEIDEVEPTTTVVSQNPVSNEDRRDNYIGYLEVPDVKIKRGFVAMDSKYNSVGYNVMLIEGSEMPDVKNGNLILAAHRGNSSVSFFDKLYKLNMGAEASVTYNNKKYTYKLKYIYTVPKVGKITISRNGDINTLTLITCTRDDKKTQTVFVFELESVK